MRQLNDFRCENQHVFEALVGTEIDTVRCSCGSPARKIISPVRFKLDGTSGDFPTAADKWARMHEDATREARKRNSAE